MTYIENYIDLYNQIKQSLDRTVLNNDRTIDMDKSLIPQIKSEAPVQKENEPVNFFNAKGISHDINNMLSVITGYLELIDEDPQSDQIEMYIKRSQEAVEIISELNKLYLNGSSAITPLDSINSIIKAVKQSLLVIIGVRPDINYTISVTPKTNFFLINPLHLKRIIQNLAKNAVEAMPQGGALSVSFENETLFYNAVPLRQSRQYVKITFKDEGTGIDEKKLKNIFNAGYTTKTNGNGLGLRISQYLIQHNDGHIDVSSSEGNGTVFTLHFPAIDISELNFLL